MRKTHLQLVLMLIFLLSSLSFLQGKRISYRDTQYSQLLQTQYVKTSSIVAMSEKVMLINLLIYIFQFFSNFQTIFIERLFNYTILNERQLEFPNTTFFLYKLPRNGKLNETDWVGSMYFTFQVNNFNITSLKYNNKDGSSSAETGIMLVESIQNFKTYFSQIQMESEFEIVTDFTRMYCNDPECPGNEDFNNGRYRGNLSLSRLNISMSQNMSVI